MCLLFPVGKARPPDRPISKYVAPVSFNGRRPRIADVLPPAWHPADPVREERARGHVEGCSEKSEDLMISSMVVLGDVIRFQAGCLVSSLIDIFWRLLFRKGTLLSPVAVCPCAVVLDSSLSHVPPICGLLWPSNNRCQPVIKRRLVAAT